MSSAIQHKLWLLKMYPVAEYIPELYDVVSYHGNPALVVTTPADPDHETFDFDSIPEDQETRPCFCDIMLGEEIVKNVDISQLKSYNV